MHFMNKYTVSAIAAASVAVASMMSACHELPDYDNSAEGNFDALWTLVDEHYCFFADKDIDWKETGDMYRSQIRPGMSSKSLFAVMSAMLDELRDGHVNLSAPFATSYYRKWWSDYPHNYDERIIQQNYFDSPLADFRLFARPGQYRSYSCLFLHDLRSDNRYP